MKPVITHVEFRSPVNLGEHGTISGWALKRMRSATVERHADHSCTITLANGVSAFVPHSNISYYSYGPDPFIEVEAKPATADAVKKAEHVVPKARA